MLTEEEAQDILAAIYRGVVLGKETNAAWRQDALRQLDQCAKALPASLVVTLRQRIRAAEQED